MREFRATWALQQDGLKEQTKLSRFSLLSQPGRLPGAQRQHKHVQLELTRRSVSFQLIKLAS